MKSKISIVIGGAILLSFLITGAAWLYAQQIPTLPLIPTPTASPLAITVNTPTVVVVTAHIQNASPVPGSVNLLRLGPAGTPSILGIMHDDGLNGDAISGDGIYTLLFTFNEHVTGDFQLQVSAAFKNTLKRLLSPIIYISVMPPDPGVAGASSVAGVDSDHDGIRDDVQRFIDVTFPQSEQLRLALRDNAKASQELLTAGTSTQATAAMTNILRSTECLSYILGSTTIGINLHTALSQMNGVEINTEDRFLAWATAQDYAGGQSFQASADRKKSCTFDPAAVSN